jgi:hypothetical protein
MAAFLTKFKVPSIPRPLIYTFCTFAPIIGLYQYDKRETKRLYEMQLDQIKSLGLETCSYDYVPRKLTFVINAKPEDKNLNEREDYFKRKSLFKKYILPLLYESAIDFEFRYLEKRHENADNNDENTDIKIEEIPFKEYVAISTKALKEFCEDISAENSANYSVGYVPLDYPTTLSAKIVNVKRLRILDLVFQS